MIDALPIPTLPDLRSMFSQQLLPLTKTGASLQASPLDGPLFASVDRLLSEPGQAPPTPADVTIEAEVARALANFEHLTEGARRIVHDARSLDRAIIAILCDKGIKAYLRSSLKAKTSRSSASISWLRNLTSPARITGPTRAAEQTGKAQETRSSGDERSGARGKHTFAKTPAAIASKANPTKTSLVGDNSQETVRNRRDCDATYRARRGKRGPLARGARYALAASLQDICLQGWQREEHRWSVEALIDALETHEAAAHVRSALNGVLQSDLRFLLIKFVELSDSGDVKFVTKALAVLKIFAMRLYAQLNAVQSAESIGRSLIETTSLFDGLPGGERRRLHDLLARCALRSGRAHEALQKYRDIIAQHPDEVGPLASYIAAVYTTDLPEAIRYAKLILSQPICGIRYQSYFHRRSSGA